MKSIDNWNIRIKSYSTAYKNLIGNYEVGLLIYLLKSQIRWGIPVHAGFGLRFCI